MSCPMFPITGVLRTRQTDTWERVAAHCTCQNWQCRHREAEACSELFDAIFWPKSRCMQVVHHNNWHQYDVDGKPIKSNNKEQEHSTFGGTCPFKTAEMKCSFVFPAGICSGSVLCCWFDLACMTLLGKKLAVKKTWKYAKKGHGVLTAMHAMLLA